MAEILLFGLVKKKYMCTVLCTVFMYSISYFAEIRYNDNKKQPVFLP